MFNIVVELKMETVENPVHDAARRGNLDFLKECFTNGVSAIELDSSGCSKLFLGLGFKKVYF